MPTSYDKELKTGLFNSLVNSLTRSGRAAIETFIGNTADEPVFVDAFSRFIAISAGDVPGVSYINKFGRNPDIDDQTTEDIWSVGNSYPFPTTAEQLDVVSSSPNDTTAGTGARTIEIQGLDSNFDELTETVTMNGTTPVTTTNLFLRVNRLVLKTTGSNSRNEGDITIDNSTDTIAQMDQNEGSSFQAIYTVPNGKTAYVLGGYATLSRKPKASGRKFGCVKFQVRKFGDGFRSLFSGDLNTEGDSSFQYAYPIPEKIEEKSDVIVRFESHNNNSRVNAGFTLVLADNV